MPVSDVTTTIVRGPCLHCPYRCSRARVGVLHQHRSLTLYNTFKAPNSLHQIIHPLPVSHVTTTSVRVPACNAHIDVPTPVLVFFTNTKPHPL